MPPFLQHDRSVETMSALAEDLEQYWTAIRPILCIRNEREYDQAVKRLNRLIDEIGTNEQHPLYELLSTWA